MSKQEANPHAVALGRLGGLASAVKVTKEQRRRYARKGGLATKRMWAERRKQREAQGQAT